jgi:hypothetical protein
LLKNNADLSANKSFKAAFVSRRAINEADYATDRRDLTTGR